MRNLASIASLIGQSRLSGTIDNRAAGRNFLTRLLDFLFASARKYAPPLQKIGAAVIALIFFIYARLLALTTRLVTTGSSQWPDVLAPSVLAVWHQNAPSLLVALQARRPHPPVTIMISRDPRGDSLAMLCRMLRLRVARGDSEEGGWEALCELAREIERGGCALITADGGGPRRVAKVGAVALASATGVPLVAVSADCRPAIFERHKWDQARTPLPFGRIAIAIGQARRFPVFVDIASVEQGRLWLQDALNDSSAQAMNRLQRSER
ncbi:MAG: DUF374 domain-containing protein [Acidobacteriota bacterium]